MNWTLFIISYKSLSNSRSSIICGAVLVVLNPYIFLGARSSFGLRKKKAFQRSLCMNCSVFAMSCFEYRAFVGVGIFFKECM